MAKNIGIIKFTGKLGGLSGRDTAFGNVIQTPGGFKSDRVKNDPIYEQTRQLYTEFGRCAKIASLFRQQLLPYLKLMPDPYVYNHIQKRMAAIKDCDADSPKGQRTVGNGLLTDAGAALFRNFSLNRDRQFYFTGMQQHLFDPEQGTLALENVDPAQFVFPDGANALGFQLVLLRMDLEQPSATMECSEFSFIRKGGETTSLLLKAPIPTGEGLLAEILFAGYCTIERDILWKRNVANVLQVISFDLPETESDSSGGGSMPPAISVE